MKTKERESSYRGTTLVLTLVILGLIFQIIATNLAFAVSNDDIKYGVMYDTRWNFPQSKFEFLKNMGVNAIEDGMFWPTFENPENTWNWNVSGCSIDQTHDNIYNAGLTWVPQISLQYKPGYFTTSMAQYFDKGPTLSGCYYGCPPNYLYNAYPLVDDFENAALWTPVYLQTGETWGTSTDQVKYQNNGQYSCKMALNGGTSYAFVYKTFAAQDWTGHKTITLWVYPTTSSSQVLLEYPNSGTGIWSSVYTLTSGRWNHIVWDISALARDSVTGFYIYCYRTSAADSYYLDQLMFNDAEYYTDRAIDAVFNHISSQGWAYPQLMFVPAGCWGESYYPADSYTPVSPDTDTYQYSAFDTDTVNLWKQYTGNSNAMPYMNNTDPGGIPTGNWTNFMNWWNSYMYANISHTSEDVNLLSSGDTQVALKVGTNGYMGQVPQEQIDNARAYGLSVVSYGGPISLDSGGSIPTTASNNGCLSRIESYFDTSSNSLESTVQDMRKNTNNYNSYFYATAFGSSSCLWNSDGSMTTNIYDFANLIDCLDSSLVSNGDFESGSTGWSLIDAGQSWGVTTSTDFMGTHSLYITSNDGIAAVSSGAITVAANTEYVVSMFAKGDHRIYVREFNSGGTLLSEHGSLDEVTSDFKYQSHKFTTKPDTATIKISMYTYASGVQTSYYDYIQLKENNLVPNGDFENGTAGWEEKDNNGGWGTTTGQYYTGSNSLYITGSDGCGAVGTGSYIFVSPNTDYVASCFARGTSDTIYVREYNAAYTQLAEHGSPQATYANWTYMAHQFTTNPNTRYVKISVYTYATGGLVSYYDNVQIKRNNMVINGGFEGGTNGWAQGDPGQSWGTTSSDYNSGANSMYIQGNDGCAAVVSDPILVDCNTSYMLSGYGKGSHSLYVREYNGSNQQICEHGSGEAVTSGWTYQNHQFLTSTTTKYITVSLYTYCTGGNYAFFDDVKLRKNNTVTNSDFEIGTTFEWSLFDSNGGWGITTTSPYLGNYCLYQNMNDGVSAVTTGPIYVANNADMVVSCYGKNSHNTYVREYNAAGTQLAEHGSGDNNTANWTYEFHNFTTNSSTSYIKVQLYCYGSSGTSYFDEVRISGGGL